MAERQGPEQPKPINFEKVDRRIAAIKHFWEAAQSLSLVSPNDAPTAVSTDLNTLRDAAQKPLQHLFEHASHGLIQRRQEIQALVQANDWKNSDIFPEGFEDLAGNIQDIRVGRFGIHLIVDRAFLEQKYQTTAPLAFHLRETPFIIVNSDVVNTGMEDRALAHEEFHAFMSACGFPLPLIRIEDFIRDIRGGGENSLQEQMKQLRRVHGKQATDAILHLEQTQGRKLFDNFFGSESMKEELLDELATNSSRENFLHYHTTLETNYSQLITLLTRSPLPHDMSRYIGSIRRDTPIWVDYDQARDSINSLYTKVRGHIPGRQLDTDILFALYPLTEFNTIDQIVDHWIAAEQNTPQS